MSVLSLSFSVEWQKTESNWFIVCFKLFPVLCMWKKNLCLYTHTSLYRDRSLLFFEDLIWFVHDLVQPYCILKTHIIITFGSIVAYLLLNHLGESMYGPPPVQTYLIAYILHSWNIIKNKVAALNGLFQTYLILIQTWIKRFLNDDFVRTTTNHNYTAWLLECIVRFSLLSVYDMNLDFTVGCIFHWPDFHWPKVRSNFFKISFHW